MEAVFGVRRPDFIGCKGLQSEVGLVMFGAGRDHLLTRVAQLHGRTSFNERHQLS